MLPWLQIVSLVFYLPVLSAYFNEPTEWSDESHTLLVQLHSPVESATEPQYVTVVKTCHCLQ